MKYFNFHKLEHMWSDTEPFLIVAGVYILIAASVFVYIKLKR